MRRMGFASSFDVKARKSGNHRWRRQAMREGFRQADASLAIALATNVSWHTHNLRGAEVA
ncbi:hypothetical protein EZM97_17790 [Dyella soli]|uniref:Uncharacterized protein n=1 Tax=Dyella soli TaxID=522319 RepID=A0A4R0YYR6_9GAMM|nr:hypothetical protein [Dyella soli]TCI10704.1 hypothetical protein EZM97_17790 [Dyella soli]